MKRLAHFTSSLLVWAGIALPLFMIALELITHQLSGACFNPMPTPWHALALFCVPLAILSTWLCLKLRHDSLTGVIASLQGLALAPALLYVLAVSPHVLHAGLLVILGAFLCVEPDATWNDFATYPGVGLAILAPVFGLAGLVIAAYRLWSMKDSANKVQLRRIQHGSILVGLLIMAWIEVPGWLTYERIKTAVSLDDSKETKATAVQLLRDGQVDSILLRLCYPPRQFSSAGALYACGPIDVFGPLTHIMNGWKGPGHDTQNPIRNALVMRDLFNQVTGKPHTQASGAEPWWGLSSWEQWVRKQER